VSAEDRFVRVADLDDPRLDDYRNVRDRDLRRDDVFLAEGDVVVRSLSRGSRYPMRSLLLSERRLPALGGLVERLPQGVPAWVLTQAAMEQVVGFRIHRGVLAAGRRTPPPTPDALVAAVPDGPARLLVLEGLTNTDNVGAIFRNAAGLRASGVLLDSRCCDPLYRKALRVSAGAVLHTPWARGGSAPALVGTLRAAGWTVVALTPAKAATSLEAFRPPQRTALVLGTEGPGLSDAALDAADHAARIEMASGVDSLNVAVAAAVALYALR